MRHLRREIERELAGARRRRAPRAARSPRRSGGCWRDRAGPHGRAPSNALRTAASSPRAKRKQTLPGAAVMQLRRVACQRRAAVDHGRQRLIVHLTRSAASCACARVSAMTAAPASPTCRTVPRASAQRGGSAIGLPSAVWIAHSGAIGPTLSAAMSAPVSTATTPGRVGRRRVSMRRMRACACGERTSTQCNSPGSVMSAT